nr:kinase-like domain-containing protein [Tanacetum cinerariifolium]
IVAVTPPDGAWTEYVSGGVTLLRISSTKHKERPLSASKTKSWLWHLRLSHLNFGAINHLARQGLVRGLPCHTPRRGLDRIRVRRRDVVAHLNSNVVIVDRKISYLDPEYFRSSKFTEKSDVYSFGVILIELFTGEKPISSTGSGEHISLAMHFLLAMEEGCIMSILDGMVIKEGTTDVLLTVANLAMRCLNLNGRYRPTMKEVATELEAIRTSLIPSHVQSNMKPIMFVDEELSILTSGDSS